MPGRDDAAVGLPDGPVCPHAPANPGREEEPLRRSEARFRAIFECAADAMILVDPAGEGRVLAANPAACLLFGYSEPEFRGLSRSAMLDPGDPSLERFVAARDEAGRNRGRLTYRRKDGSRFQGELTSVVFEEEGRRCAVAIVRDVTDRLLAEESLRREKEAARASAGLLEATFGSLAFGALVYGADGAILRVNQAAERILGVSAAACRATYDAASRVTLLRLSRADGTSLEADETPAVRALRGEPVQDCELRLRRPDGEARWISASAAPIAGADGRPGGAVVTFIDITARKHAEDALRESERQYRTMGETLPYGVWRCNADGGSEYVSQSFLDLLGMTQEEQREFGWTHRLPPEDVEPMLERWLACVRTGAPWDSEHRVLGPDGRYHTILTRGLPVRDETGKITSWVGINLDIDDRKRMEEELRDADRRKADFLAVLSHELRNPLAPIANSLFVLDRAAPGSEPATRAKEVIRRQVDHLGRIVADLLDITRISNGKIRLQRTRVDLAEVAREACEDARSLFENAGIELALEPVAGPLWIDADRTRIAQVLANLLQNAVKFTTGGGRVRVDAGAVENRAWLRVRDDGQGIASEDLGRIFEPFAQAVHGLARTQGGLGLGLALVKGMIEAHGGTVRAHSDGLGHGSEFVFTLPLGPAGADA